MPKELRPSSNKISPESAKRKLEHMGFMQNYWDKLMKNNSDSFSFGSHEIRALITIARGTEPRIFEEVYLEIRKTSDLPE